MVRFIIDNPNILFEFVNEIYIPIWLDLLLKNGEVNPQGNQSFTFQYG